MTEASSPRLFVELRPDRIVETGRRLRDRIRERFPEANLGRVADELVEVAQKYAERSAVIRRPNVWLRAAGILGLLLVIAMIIFGIQAVHPTIEDNWPLREVLAAVEAAVATVVFLSAAVVFAWNLDVRQKRGRCLDAIHEMRAMAHIVDMHQLTKDPDRAVHPGGDTKSSPKRTMTQHELVRYFDYCSEMLSLIGKVAAMYVQGFPDAVALQAVDDIENLTTSLSRKIWQKIMILEQSMPAGPSPA